MEQEFYAKIRCKNCKFGCRVDGYTKVGDTVAGLRHNIKRQARACHDEVEEIIEAYIMEGSEKRMIEMRL